MDIPKKVFISYKYSDVVAGREGSFNFRDELITLLGENGLVHKGEDEESFDLSSYNEQQIVAKIAPYIKKSSITVLLVSPNAINSEWIPWEISMSLRQRTYEHEQNMTRNGVVGVYLPLDRYYNVSQNGEYTFYRHKRDCGVVEHHTNILPAIVRDNTFNLINGEYTCEKGCCSHVYSMSVGSYIELVDWSDFISNMSMYLENAWKRRNQFEKYEVRINLNGGY